MHWFPVALNSRPTGTVMRTILLTVVMATCTCLVPAGPASAQSTGEKQAVVPLPIPPRHAGRPKLSLERALEIAKSQLKGSNAEISGYWLLEGRFSLYGDGKLADKDTVPCWVFTWLSDEPSHPAIDCCGVYERTVHDSVDTLIFLEVLVAKPESRVLGSRFAETSCMRRFRSPT